MCPNVGFAGFHQQCAGDLASWSDEPNQVRVNVRFASRSRTLFKSPQAMDYAAGHEKFPADAASRRVWRIWRSVSATDSRRAPADGTSLGDS
jgi:hypothetical protein